MAVAAVALTIILQARVRARIALSSPAAGDERATSGGVFSDGLKFVPRIVRLEIAEVQRASQLKGFEVIGVAYEQAALLAQRACRFLSRH